MSCSVAKLIAETVSMNEIGVPVPTETARQIYVFEKSVTGTEWHEAGRHGINHAVCLITPRCNYAGEKIAEYEGDFLTYAPGAILAFLNGNTPLNDDTWNEFVTECDNLGINEIIAVYQNAYDEYIAGER